MAIILFSIYYPHEKRFGLVRDGILPLLGKIKYDRMDYFLSTYKGENLSMMFKTSYKDSKTIIENHFHDFFVDHGIEVAEKQLPLNQLFLDFKPNTLHIWDFNPFKNKQRDLAKLIIQKKESELSDKCLSVLANSLSWDKGESVQFYLNILIIISFLLQLDSVTPSRFANALQFNLKSKFNRKVDLFQEYLKNGEGIFTSNRLSIIRHYEYVREIAKNGDVKDNDLSEWVSLVKNWMVSPDSHNQISSIDQCVSLIFNLNQKIDLNPKGLVIALGILQRLNQETIL